MKYSLAALTVAASVVSAYNLPDNLAQIYNKHKVRPARSSQDTHCPFLTRRTERSMQQ